MATIVQAEFSPLQAERPIDLNAGGLFSACLFKPKLRWFGADAELLSEETESVSKVELDNDGNAFAVLFALPSCAPGGYLVQANLEESPFSTFFTEFDIASPPVPGPTELAYTGPLTVAHGDPFLASAKLTVPAGGIAGGRQIAFVLGPNAGESCTAETSSSGEAQCSLTPSQSPGAAKITAAFAGSPELAPTETAAPVTITPDETKLSYIGATMAQYRHAFIAAAKLEDPDGATPLAARKVTFTLGNRNGKSTKHGKHCTATTSSQGIAECQLEAAQAGTYPIAASFSGDAEDEPSSASATVSVEARESACTVSSLPSFVDQGEFGETSSIADIVHVTCSPVWAERHVELSAGPLYIECAEHLSWAAPNAPTALQEGASFNVELDDDGNATAVLFGGPSCAAGTGLISAHLLAPPFTTVTTDLQVLPPQPTPEGLQALPASEIEDSTYSSVATIVQIEFPPKFAERNVEVSSEQLDHGCMSSPHLVWIGPDETIFGEGGEPTATTKLDNDGNAFVVLFGAQSCAPGEYLIEARLEQPPYDELDTTFTIEPPRSTL